MGGEAATMKTATPSRVLPFVDAGAARPAPRVGRVHRDGSITYRGETYPTIKDLPADCLAIRLDQEAYRQWRRLYRVIRPDARHARGRPAWPEPG
jgi:hypothetical protein